MDGAVCKAITVTVTVNGAEHPEPASLSGIKMDIMC